jgi:hypothetical protein
MSIRRLACFAVSCDACRTDLGDRDGDYTLYFDTEDDALTAALELGWRIDTDGALFCSPCIDVLACVADGHDYGPWIPCHCHGRLPGHDLWGCGLFRTCRRDGCGDTDITDLAHLPTTDEPTPSGR